MLKRELGVLDAVMMGMGSIIGTGIFVSIGIAAGITGPAILLATAIGAVVALLDGLSSAQLAANHPVSGGTYEYGYRFLRPAFGFTAGWMFLIAKSASAATAALGVSGYLLSLLGIAGNGLQVIISITTVVILTLIILRGIRWSSRMNITIVSVTLIALLFFVVAGLPEAIRNGAANFRPFFSVPLESSTDGSDWSISDLLHATALMFVAFTGYGRIATLGEEVKDPRRTIPRAIVIALFAIMALYLSVIAVAVGSAGAPLLAAVTEGRAAPLIAASRTFTVPGAPLVLTIGAVTAMIGVLLNLILGLSRVLLAMGRRADMPVFLGRLDRSGTTPAAAVITISILICLLTLIGNVRVTWSFSAFSVLMYYAITNLAALFLKRDERLFPRWIPAAGLLLCLSLAFFIDRTFWLIGLGLIALGLVWFSVARRIQRDRNG